MLSKIKFNASFRFVASSFPFKELIFELSVFALLSSDAIPNFLGSPSPIEYTANCFLSLTFAEIKEVIPDFNSLNEPEGQILSCVIDFELSISMQVNTELSSSLLTL